jgi:hypothetical protein
VSLFIDAEFTLARDVFEGGSHAPMQGRDRAEAFFLATLRRLAPA